jgi:hypothetical protein
MEALRKLLTATVHRGLPSGFFVGSRSSEVVNISHLLFVNDILFFVGIILTIFAIYMSCSCALKLSQV